MRAVYHEKRKAERVQVRAGQFYGIREDSNKKSTYGFFIEGTGKR
jgi:hypothetical protein